MTITNIDDDKMDEIENSEETWLVEYGAEWCGPCQKLAPRLNRRR